MARRFHEVRMALDQNEKKLIKKLSTALNLLDASEEDLRFISGAKKVDEDFFQKANEIFHKTEACDVCRHAFHSWRNTLDDEIVLSFIDDWINWKKLSSNVQKS